MLLIGGEAEGDRLTRLTAGLPRSRWRCAQELGLADLGAVIGCCSGFLGHDSGITHLAAAVGKPVIVMWGPTVWEVWHPSGDTVKVLRSRDALSALGISEVETCLAGIGF